MGESLHQLTKTITVDGGWLCPSCHWQGPVESLHLKRDPSLRLGIFTGCPHCHSLACEQPPKTLKMFSYDGGISWLHKNTDAQRRQRARIIANTVLVPHQRQAILEKPQTHDPDVNLQIRIRQAKAQTQVEDLKLKTQNSKRRHGKSGLQQFSEKTKRPVLLPVERTFQSLLGRAAGKNQKHRRSLRPKKERLPRARILSLENDLPIYRNYAVNHPNVEFHPLHRHRCHKKSYLCACAEPQYPTRPCGDTFCLQVLLKKVFSMFTIPQIGRYSANIPKSTRNSKLKTKKG
jgi:hypothetical protein